MRCGRDVGLHHKGGEDGEEVVAVVGGDFQHDGFVEVEAENAEDGLRVHDVFAALQGQVKVVARGDVDKLFDRFGGVQLDFTDFMVFSLKIF